MDREQDVNSKASRKNFEPGKNYSNSFTPPGKPPEGYTWMIVKRHPDKHYATTWTLTSLVPEVPDMNQLPPVNPKTGKEIKDFQPQLPEIEDEHF